MKILIFNWQDLKNPFAGGAEVHMHEIFKRIVLMGHEVTLFASMFEGAPAIEILDGIKIIRGGNRNLFNFYVPLKYKREFAKQNFDIVIDDINKIPFYTPMFVKKPLLAISHHFFGKSIFKEAGFFAGTYVITAEKFVDYIYKKIPFAVVSESTLSEFRERGFDERKFEIVLNGITIENFPFKVQVETYEPSITYFGRLKKYKSVDHVLKAFAKVSTEFPNLKLNIIGSGDFKPYLENLANDLDVEKRIKFWGFVSEKQKIELLSQTFVVINPSIKEGWGITNIEANACGTPVISADSPGLRDSVSVGVSGELYPYGKIDILAEYLRKIISDSNYRKKLSEDSLRWARGFSWDKSAEKMLKLIEKTISNFKQ